MFCTCCTVNAIEVCKCFWQLRTLVKTSSTFPLSSHSPPEWEADIALSFLIENSFSSCRVGGQGRPFDLVSQTWRVTPYTFPLLTPSLLSLSLLLSFTSSPPLFLSLQVNMQTTYFTSSETVFQMQPDWTSSSQNKRKNRWPIKRSVIGQEVAQPVW
jgi:hypothetical protein